jgi:hypothetical protein
MTVEKQGNKIKHIAATSGTSLSAIKSRSGRAEDLSGRRLVDAARVTGVLEKKTIFGGEVVNCQRGAGKCQDG